MTNRKHIPTLTTPWLTLHPYALADAETLYRILGEPNILQFILNPDSPSMERVKKIIENKLKHWDEYGLGWWAVVPHRQTELIGLKHPENTGLQNILKKRGIRYTSEKNTSVCNYFTMLCRIPPKRSTKISCNSCQVEFEDCLV
jgi:hypothetical protein